MQLWQVFGTSLLIILAHFKFCLRKICKKGSWCEFFLKILFIQSFTIYLFIFFFHTIFEHVYTHFSHSTSPGNFFFSSFTSTCMLWKTFFGQFCTRIILLVYIVYAMSPAKIVLLHVFDIISLYTFCNIIFWKSLKL